MKEKKSDTLFRDKKEIPVAFDIEVPIVQREYLVKGALRPWHGSFRKVYSPVSLRIDGQTEPYLIGEQPLLTGEAALEALEAAAKAFDKGSGPWPSMSPARRIALFRRFVSEMKKKRTEIARLLMWEVAKPYGDALKEFDRTVEYIDDTIRALQREEKDARNLVTGHGIAGRIRRVPRGVALCMGPYNYPLYETFTAVAPALLTGNTVVFKPPRYGGFLFGPLLEIFRDVFPEGTVNVVYGNGREIMPPLMASGMVDVFAFIGTGWVADGLKRLHPKPQRLKSILGLEAKNPAIILPDADLDKAVRECVLGAFAFNGQRCAALKIFFVHVSLVEDFMERFVAEVSRLRMGMPWKKGVFLTPLVEESRAGYLSGVVEDALKLGARVMNPGGGVAEGTFFSPTVLYPVDSRMRIFHEEQFGPVAPIVPYDGVEEVLEYVRESRYGQQASVFGRDKRVLEKVIGTLVHHVSRVNVNCKCQRTPDVFPFTGRKDSAEGVLSVSDALDAFTVPAVVAVREGSEGVLRVKG